MGNECVLPGEGIEGIHCMEGGAPRHMKTDCLFVIRCLFVKISGLAIRTVLNFQALAGWRRSQRERGRVGGWSDESQRLRLQWLANQPQFRNRF
jgi:hypothetical protein